MDAQSRILEAVRAGASIDEAAREAGTPVGTVRRWLTQGRKRQDGSLADFAAQVDAIRSGRREAERELDAPVSLGEAEAVLARAVRKGSIPALKLWFDRHDRQDGGAEDELSWLDRS